MPGISVVAEVIECTHPDDVGAQRLAQLCHFIAWGLPGCDEDEYDGKVNIGLCELALKLQAALPRQSDVEDDATGRIGALAMKELPRRSEGKRCHTDRLKEIFQAFPHGRVVIDNENDRVLFRHKAGSSDRNIRRLFNRAAMPIRLK